MVSRETVERKIIRVLRVLGLVFFAVITLFPFYWMIVSSLKPLQEILMNPARPLAGHPEHQPSRVLRSPHGSRIFGVHRKQRVRVRCDRSSFGDPGDDGGIRGHEASVSGTEADVFEHPAHLHVPGHCAGDPLVRGLFPHGASGFEKRARPRLPGADAAGGAVHASKLLHHASCGTGAGRADRRVHEARGDLADRAAPFGPPPWRASPCTRS